MSDTPKTQVQLLRQALLEWLPPYPQQTTWDSLSAARQWVDRAQLERVCTEMLRLGEIVNGCRPSSGDLASHIRRPKPPNTDLGSTKRR